MSELLTPHQAAKRLQISEKTLKRHVDAQELAAIHIGQGRVKRRLRFDPADLEAFKQRQKAQARELIGSPPWQSSKNRTHRTSIMNSNSKVTAFAVLREKLRERERKK